LRTSLRAAVLALLLAWLLLPGHAAAQRRGSGGALIHGPIEIGPRVGRDFKNHAWTLGGQIRVPVDRTRAAAERRPDLPRDDGMGWQLNGDAAIRIGQGGGLYAGGGVALVHPDDGETETGYNLFFGLSTAPPNAPMKPFLEFRWTDVADTRPFRLMLGFSWTL
jgi:hypothetical protein